MLALICFVLGLFDFVLAWSNFSRGTELSRSAGIFDVCCGIFCFVCGIINLIIPS